MKGERLIISICTGYCTGVHFTKLKATNLCNFELRSFLSLRMIELLTKLLMDLRSFVSISEMDPWSQMNNSYHTKRAQCIQDTISVHCLWLISLTKAHWLVYLHGHNKWIFKQVVVVVQIILIRHEIEGWSHTNTRFFMFLLMSQLYLLTKGMALILLTWFLCDTSLWPLIMF